MPGQLRGGIEVSALVADDFAMTGRTLSRSDEPRHARPGVTHQVWDGAFPNRDRTRHLPAALPRASSRLLDLSRLEVEQVQPGPDRPAAALEKDGQLLGRHPGFVS